MYIRRHKANIALAVWLAALCTGSWWATAYQFKSEKLAEESYAESWPVPTRIEPSRHGSTLILFLHPKCPCSRASLSQLERLLADVQERGIGLPRVYVVATLPEIGSDDWTNTENLQRAAKLPGANVVIDRGGVEAARFGAAISGAIMIFDETGKRRYAGGITPARGMEGANAGCDAALAVLQSAKKDIPNIPAFGCRLCLPHESQSSTQCVNNLCPAKANL